MPYYAYLGEIRMFAGNYPPVEWAFCDGQILAIKDHEALFSLLGTMYGGDGRTSFALPDLRGRMALHSGVGAGPGLREYREGQRGGHESVVLTAAQLPVHSHWGTLKASSGGGSSEGNALTAGDNTGRSHDIQMTTGSVGDDQPHDNMPPYQAVNFIICLEGIYPPRS